MAQTEKRKPGRPATGTTPLRRVRIPDDLWQRATVRAKQRGETVSAAIRRALDDYTR